MRRSNEARRSDGELGPVLARRRPIAITRDEKSGVESRALPRTVENPSRLLTAPDRVRALFTRFREQAAELRAELLASVGPTLPGSAQAEADANLKVARSVFGKWCIEILVVLFPRESTRFNELRRTLPGITSDALSRKLRVLEEIGLVDRTVGPGRPPTVNYRLTEDGKTLARMGEPIFLFLRLRANDRMRSPAAGAPPRA